MNKTIPDNLRKCVIIELDLYLKYFIGQILAALVGLIYPTSESGAQAPD